MSTPEDQMGEVLELDEPLAEVEDTDDGGAIVSMEEGEAPFQEERFFDNIVLKFPESELEALSQRLLEDINRDKKARDNRVKQYEEAIKRTGLGKEAPGGAEFEGASQAVHPMLTEACVDFAARAVRELLPSNGPVKTFVPGSGQSAPTKERLDKADRKKTYMNWQFTVQMTEFRAEFEQLLTQLPLGGSQFMRLVYDEKRKRPVPIFVPIDDVYLPFAASSYYAAERCTYVEHITKYEYDQRVKSGMYRDVASVVAGMPDESAAEKATQKVEGKAGTGVYNEDGLRDEFEVSCFCELEEEYDSAPYRITIDSAARKIVSIIRNWEEEDEEAKEPMFWMIEFPFIPWRGAYSIGLGQMIGSLAGGATGALRALLDSAHINNMPTLLRLKGANFSGQNKELNVAEVTEIEGGIAGDDIRKLVMPVPYNPPSQTLFQLLGFLVDAGRGVVRTTFEKLADQQPNMPVGTTLALIEEGMKVMSAIHLRMFHSMSMVIRVLHRIDRMYLMDEEVLNETGEMLAYRDDFQLPLDVVPTADPEVFSDTQRLAQLQIVADRAAQMPDIYNRRMVEQRILERSKIPNPEELLNPIPKPEDMNAVNENAAMVMQRPVAAFPEQEHLAHLQVHLDFLLSPTLGSLPIMAPTFIPMCLEHIKEHITLWYVTATFEMLQDATGKDDEALKQMLEFQDPDTRKELDRTLAAISQKIVPGAQETLGALPSIVQRAQETMQQFQQEPKMPVDPNKMADIQAKQQTEREKMQAKRQSDQERAQLQKEVKFLDSSARERQSQLDAAVDEARQAREFAARLGERQFIEVAESKRLAAELAAREQINKEDNLTALTIAAAEIESGEKVGVETGTGINPSA